MKIDERMNLVIGIAADAKESLANGEDFSRKAGGNDGSI